MLRPLRSFVFKKYNIPALRAAFFPFYFRFFFVGSIFSFCGFDWGGRDEFVD